MSHDGRAIANFVLDECASKGRRVTNLSLQKIVYFCHVWSLIGLGRPLIKHQFEAWQFGPVLQYLYREFNAFERDPIEGRSMKIDPLTGTKVEVGYQLESDTEELMKKVVDFYSRLTASELVHLSHVEGGPWHSVWNHSGKVNPGMKIDDATIASFYSRVPKPFTVQ
jgi:uncharacterized phage-associated protein